MIAQPLPNATLRVNLDDGHDVLADVSGRICTHCVPIVPGGNVAVGLRPYDLSRGRIAYRYE